ncbi:putative mucin/carbohydrate-binding domain-containing protein [Listeria booriae]|uniref:putative mucin/carbohydrate-binding domain-containing protein n=1 Tax=Listeria booriae TaxID=1552123 RepID=UPI001627EE0B|nr:putative mucin/carbohydrate-binding domain-containing protein [Listeria booriae]MBC2676726.1 hypothetical protein [Listeria booriae]
MTTTIIKCTKKFLFPIIALLILFGFPMTPKAIIAPPELVIGTDIIRPVELQPGVGLVNSQETFLWGMLDMNFHKLILTSDIKFKRNIVYHMANNTTVDGQGHTLDFNGFNGILQNNSFFVPENKGKSKLLDLRFENLKIKKAADYAGAFQVFDKDFLLTFKNISQLDSSKLVTGGAATINLEGSIAAPYEIKDSFDNAYISGNHIFAKSGSRVTVKATNTAIQPHTSFTIEKNAEVNLTSTRGSAIKAIREYSPTLTNNGKLQATATQATAVMLGNGAMILNADSNTQLAGKTALATNDLTVKSQATLKASSSSETFQIGKTVKMENGSNFSMTSSVSTVFNTMDPFDPYSMTLPTAKAIVASLDIKSKNGLTTWKKGATSAASPHNVYGTSFESEFSIYKPNMLQNINSKNKDFLTNYKNNEVGKVEGGSFVNASVTEEVEEQEGLLKGQVFNFKMMGLGDWEFAKLRIDLTNNKATIQKNAGDPHWYFVDTYASIEIRDNNNKVIYSDSMIGRTVQPKSSYDVKLGQGYTISVMHREHQGRLAFTNEATNESYKTDEVNTYRVTSNGLLPQ